MKYFKSFEEYNLKENVILIMGNFDGCHIGHRALFERGRELRKDNEKIYLITFYPSSKVGNDKEGFLLQNEEEKSEVFYQYEIDGVFSLDFFKDIRHLTKEEFLEDLKEVFDNISVVILGENFRFGNGRNGEPGDFFNVTDDVEILKLLWDEGKAISSTVIRNYIGEGDFLRANRLLKRTYRLEGIIVQGYKLGRKMGFPTANIDFDKRKVLPKFGVYIVEVIFEGKKYFGICNVGSRPTFKRIEKEIVIEVHILNFDRDIYGVNLIIGFIKKIRDEIKFSSINELVKAIEKDKLDAINYCKNFDNSL